MKAAETGGAATRRGALLLVMLDIDPAIDDDDFNRWYFAEHIAERLACPGVLAARRFRAVVGEPRYLALYELESPQALETEEYRSLARSKLTGNSVAEPRGSARTFAMLDGFRNTTRNVYVEIDSIRAPIATH
jgi:hypothetical protein